MSFFNEIQNYSWNTIEKKIYSKTSAEVEKALNKPGQLTPEDFMALLSPAASDYIEEMAQISQQLTLKRFGKTIQLYIPLYLSNECTNSCVYCGFNHQNKIARKTLSKEEIRNEARKIKEMGFEHILLVTGEHPKKTGFEYLQKVIQEMTKIFSMVSIEVQPMETDEYKKLEQLGLNAVYIYQETYNQRNYKNYHPTGKKSNFRHRLETPERIGEAEMHKIGLGVLLGLEDWRVDSLFTALHMRYLQKHYWKTNFSISFPRLRPFEGSYQPNYEISDKQLVQLITAYRIFDENVELALSTRESPYFRDNVFPLGITTMSAGSKTEPGGYYDENEELEQFKVADERHPKTIKQVVESKGYEAVWKNWDEALDYIRATSHNPQT
jgi:2-iminoacetate synthase